jgi:histidyl-tRNA synthetase
MVLGTNELETGKLIIKDLELGTEEVGAIEHLITYLITQQK